MDFGFSAEEQDVVDAVRGFGGGARVWEELVGGGWCDLLLDGPTGLAYLGLVAEELGAAGAVVPLVGAAVVYPTLFGQSAGGQRVGVSGPDLIADDGVDADIVVVLPGGEWTGPRQAPGAEAYAASVAGTTPVGDLECDPLARVSLGDQVASCTEPARVELAGLRATAVVAAEMTGAVRRVTEMTLEHVKTREQFGRPLARFQVVQHAAAELATLHESITWISRLAVHDPTPVHVAAAKAWAGEAAAQACALAHQMHGAIGFTEEYGLQRLTKRLRVLRFTAGDDGAHAARLGALLAAAPTP